MKKILAALTVGVFAASVTLPALAQDKVDNELTEASQIIQEMTGPQQSAGIPNDILRNAKCIAVIPKLIKAGFGIGGEHGNGVATCKVQDGRWSPPAPFSMSGGSFGLQIGGEEVGYIMLAMTDDGMQALMSGHFKVGAGINAAAGPVGRDASASAGWKGAALLSYSRAKGAYAGATLNGTELIRIMTPPNSSTASRSRSTASSTDRSTCPTRVPLLTSSTPSTTPSATLNRGSKRSRFCTQLLFNVAGKRGGLSGPPLCTLISASASARLFSRALPAPLDLRTGHPA